MNDDFYDEAFRRGVAAFEAGDYVTALSRLRIAEFGYIDDVTRFENANAYIAVAARRLQRTAEATAALRRIAAAERVEPHFAALAMSDALRGAVAEAANALLTPQQAAMLTKPPATQQLSANTPTPPPSTAHDPAALLADADRALAAGDLVRARDDATAVLATPDLPHATLLKAGEGLYRARDFGGAVRAFERAGTFAKGEEVFRYYFAVALYESGRYRDAKRELAAALPFIEKTPDVERYRGKIEHALD